MGYIWNHDISSIKNKYNISNFIETGTYKGLAIKHLSKFNFDKYYTIEYYNEFIKHALINLTGIKNVKIYQGTSPYSLKIIMKELNSKPTLFWLDAHLPELYPEIKEKVDDDNFRFPLINELKSIINNRDFSKDYFIIDDLRIYENNSYQNGNCDELYKPKNKDLSILNNFIHTHEIIRDLRDEGYLILKPKYINLL